MDRYTVVGTVLVAVGLAGYVAGIAVAYPGRALSIAAVMVGISLIAIPAAPEWRWPA